LKKEKQQVTEEMAALRSELENTKAELERAKAELEVVKAREQALLQQLAAVGAETNGTADEQMLARVQELQRENEELQARAQATQPIQTVVDNTEEIEAEVQRRVAEIEANIQANLEAEVQRRLGEFQAAQGAEEGEVVDAGRPVSAPPVVEHAQVATAPQMSEEEFEAKVAARVEEILPARMEEKFAEKEKVIQDRIKTAQSKFQEYKTVAINKAVEECEAKHKVKEEEYKKRIAELEAEIANLKAEIEQLRAKVAELESRPATTVETGIKKEDLEAALAAKDAEHQAAIAALKTTKPETDFEEAKQALRMEVQAEMMTIQQNIENAEVTPEAAAARDKEKEKLKAIISRNVEHRLNKEKEKWKAEIEAQREALIDEKVQAALKERVAELETKMQEKEASLKAELEKSKDAIRQEGVMRSKVQINMLERKNKMLEDKLKASQGGEQPSTATPTASAGTTSAPATAQPPHQQLPTGIRRPSAVGTAIPQPPTQAAQPQTQNQNLQAAQQAAIAAAEQATANQPPAPQRRADHGTGPGMLRQLRGALITSSIPRGGAMGAGRGRGSTAPSQAGSPTQPPQQQQQNPFAGQTGITNPFAAASGIPNPFAGGAQQARGGGIPRGRGAFAGRGRGGQQQAQTGGIPQPAQGAAGSPTRGGAQLNPGARQFVPPGNKRTREGADDDSGSEGKRARSSIGGGGQPPAGGVQGQQGQQ
jgi:nucleoprotein TPR